MTRLSVQVRVSRKNMLLSAEKVMETYASHRAVLELEYFGEVGTGLGPTLEFYTLLSHELQRKGLGMWRSDTGKDSEAAAAQGIHHIVKIPGSHVCERRNLYSATESASNKMAQDLCLKILL